MAADDSPLSEAESETGTITSASVMEKSNGKVDGEDVSIEQDDHPNSATTKNRSRQRSDSLSSAGASTEPLPASERENHTLPSSDGADVDLHDQDEDLEDLEEDNEEREGDNISDDDDIDDDDDGEEGDSDSSLTEQESSNSEDGEEGGGGGNSRKRVRGRGGVNGKRNKRPPPPSMITAVKQQKEQDDAEGENDEGEENDDNEEENDESELDDLLQTKKSGLVESNQEEGDEEEEDEDDEDDEEEEEGEEEEEEDEEEEDEEEAEEDSTFGMEEIEDGNRAAKEINRGSNRRSGKAAKIRDTSKGATSALEDSHTSYSEGAVDDEEEEDEEMEKDEQVIQGEEDEEDEDIEEDEDDAEDGSEDEEADPDVTPNGKRKTQPTQAKGKPSKRPKRGGGSPLSTPKRGLSLDTPLPNGSSSSLTALDPSSSRGTARAAISPSPSLTDVEDKRELAAESSEDDDDVEQDSLPSSSLVTTNTKRGARGGKRGRGGRWHRGRGGRGAGRGGAGAISTMKPASSLRDTSRSVSPFPSSDEDEDQADGGDDEVDETATPTRRETSEASPMPVLEVTEENEEEAEIAIPVPSTRGGRGKARGRGGRGRAGWRGGSRAAMTRNTVSTFSADESRSRSSSFGLEAEAVGKASRSGSTSTTAETTYTGLTKKRKDAELAEAASAELTALDALADLSAPGTDSALATLTDEPKLLVDELKRLKDEGAMNIDGDLSEQDLTAKVDQDKDSDGELAEFEGEDDTEAGESSEKRPSKAGRKGGKSKQVDGAEEEGEVDATPVESDREEEPDPDDAFMRKRAEAMEALSKIEIDFAGLRDRLYVERIAEIEKERVGIDTGTHPELLHLTQLIVLRRDKKLEMAKKWLNALETIYDNRRISSEYTAWIQWADGRADLRTSMLDEANSKRRKLDREKRFLDRPKDAGLTPLLAPRPPPAVPLQYRRRVGWEGEALVENEIAWALRHPDLRADASVSALEEESTWADLERMGLREPMRMTNMFLYDNPYDSLGPPNYPDPRLGLPGTSMAAFPFAPSPYEASGAGLQQHHHFTPSLGALPPLPTAPRIDFQGRSSSNSPCPPSNPRSNAFAKDSGSSHSSSYNSQQTGLRVYPSSGHFPTSYADLEVDRMHGQPWPKHAGHHGPSQAMYQFDDSRRQGGGTGVGLADSLDIVAEHHPRRNLDDQGKMLENGGGSSKSRLTLDDHMASTRSPKAASSSSHKADLNRNNPSFMSIPSFSGGGNHHSHTSQHQAMPHPPVLPPQAGAGSNNSQSNSASGKIVFPNTVGSPVNDFSYYGHNKGEPPTATQRSN